MDSQENVNENQLDNIDDIQPDLNENILRSGISDNNAQSMDGGSVFTEKKQKKKKIAMNIESSALVNYHGTNIFQAASQGNLPLCVLLWGMASAKRLVLMAVDSFGNNPIHFAALADTTEVVGFFMQQTKGYLHPHLRLVDSRNHAGETALLRAMSNGVISVARVLVDEGSDVFAVDCQGNTVFSILAKGGHLWGMHFMLEVISVRYGRDAALSLLAQVDGEGHSPLDWAASQGQVNVLEYLLRQGLCAYRVDAEDHSALFWAVKSGQTEAARFLVKSGCDPFQQDTGDISPMQLARESKNVAMMDALSVYDKNVRARHVAGQQNHVLMLSCPEEQEEGASSHAIYLRNPSRISHVMAFSLVVTVAWMLSIVMPFYAWILFIGATLFLFRRYERVASRALELANYERHKISTLNELLSCPEKGLGMWLGSAVVFLVYLISCLFWAETGDSGRVYRVSDSLTIRLHDPLGIAGVDGEVGDELLFWFVFASFLLSAALWAKLVWLDPDPGRVDTRDADFDEILEEAMVAGGTPNTQRFCATTLVKKPLRSKYCARSGFVVARMDHFCMWLNLTVGHANHRAFVLFLLAHLSLAVLSSALIIRALHREVGSWKVFSCNVLISVLSRKCFYTTTLCAFMLLFSLALVLLLAEQLRNIALNLTINEKINRARYSYLHTADNQPCNPFDRGVVGNVLEFLGVPGYALDYYRIFDLPPPPNSSSSSSVLSSFSRWTGRAPGHYAPTDRLDADPNTRYVDSEAQLSPPSDRSASAMQMTQRRVLLNTGTIAQPPQQNNLQQEQQIMQGATRPRVRRRSYNEGVDVVDVA